ncbi:MAG: peptide deformylase [Clostridia bacterium]
MALRTIRVQDDPCLYKHCRPVEKFDKKLSELIDDMFETMYKSDGAGLAAPQIGILRRIAVMDGGDRKIELINPEILHSSGCFGGYEGCLSFPGKTGYVERADLVRIRAYDRHGVPHEYELHLFEARIVQHELDHLDGIVYLSLVKDPPEGFHDEE